MNAHIDLQSTLSNKYIIGLFVLFVKKFFCIFYNFIGDIFETTYKGFEGRPRFDTKRHSQTVNV